MTNANVTEVTSPTSTPHTGVFALDVILAGTNAVTVSGNIVQISGQAVTTSVSGNIVQISGQAVTTSVSGNIVQISGQTIITSISGNVVTISGSQIELNPLTKVLTGNILAVTNNSGGVVLSSGVISSVSLKAYKNNSGDIYVGGSVSPYLPYSGNGLILSASEAVSLDVNNFNDVFVFATISGDVVSFAGAQQ